jgi:hypothetical protein
MVYLPTGPVLVTDIAAISAVAANPPPAVQPGSANGVGVPGKETGPSNNGGPAPTGNSKKAAGQTISMEEADYTEDGPVPSKRCKNCSMFRVPDSCTLVRGDINPAGHCRYFKAR